MEFLRKTEINFLSKSKYAFILSGLLVAACIASLIIKKGPNYGIDFTGGTLLQVKFEQSVDLDVIRGVLSENEYPENEIQNIIDDNSVIIRIKSDAGKTDEVGDKIFKIITASLPDNPGILERVEFVGPAVGRYLKKSAVQAVFFSMIGIIIYVAVRFKAGVWGIAGVVAIAHDVFITFGIFSILNKEINLNIIAALLTLAGYSINDTIVIFDRIRENIRLYRKDALDQIINRSINETLSRSVITSVTTLFPLTAIYFLGGAVLRDFSLALIIGIIAGTYSTLFIASPIVYNWNTKQMPVKTAKA